MDLEQGRYTAQIALQPKQFYAPVVPDMSSRGRMIYSEITSFRSTHDTYTLIHVLIIDVDLIFVI